MATDMVLGGGHSYDTVQHMDDRKTLSTTAAVAFE